jgi:hypothetical protein
LAKLRLVLDNEYEYIENELFDKGFKNAIKRFLRGEKNKLKTRLNHMLYLHSTRLMRKVERILEYSTS